MLNVPKSEAEISNILKLWYISQGKGRFATDSQCCIRMSDGDPRTGMFHQIWVTTHDTTCSVNEVLEDTEEHSKNKELTRTLVFYKWFQVVFSQICHAYRRDKESACVFCFVL